MHLNVSLCLVDEQARQSLVKANYSENISRPCLWMNLLYFCFSWWILLVQTSYVIWTVHSFLQSLRIFLRILSHLLKNSLMENFIFWAVNKIKRAICLSLFKKFGRIYCLLWVYMFKKSKDAIRRFGLKTWINGNIGNNFGNNHICYYFY